MTDEGFRELQLTGKKLVFLFMVGAVVLVVIFLLGVMVGRGVRGPGGADVTSAQATTEAGQPAADAGPLPPPTKPAPGDLDYATLVAGGDAKKGIEPPSTPPDAVADAAAPPPSTPRAAPPAAKEPAKPAPAKNAAAPVPPDATPATAAPATAAWVVQVSALKTKTAADRAVAALKAKGYAAFVVGDSGSLFHVQVGPFADKAEAERTRAQLQKAGYKPLIKR
jgi:cell division septation protein DedD